MSLSLNSRNSARTLTGSRRRRERRGFTLLELVVALVVLGILAALAVPTYLTVIGNAKSAVATSDALSVATDAVAIASGSDSVAVESNFYTAANVESSNVALASSPDYTTGGGASSITLAVTLGSGVYDVVVTWPDSVNAAPYVTSVSGGSDPTTTTSTTTSTTTTTEPEATTTTTTPVADTIACTWGVAGTIAPDYSGEVLARDDASYNGGATDLWGSCAGIAGNYMQISTMMDANGGTEILTLADDDAFQGSGSVNFTSEPSWDLNNGTTFDTTDANPGRLDLVDVVWYDNDADAESAYPGLTPGTAVVYSSGWASSSVTAIDTVAAPTPGDAG